MSYLNPPDTGDIVYVTKRGPYRGRRGKVIRTEMDCNMSSYDCGYHYTVKLGRLKEPVYLTDRQVSLKRPKKRA